METQTQKKPDYLEIYKNYGQWRARESHSDESKKRLTTIVLLSYVFLEVIIAYWILFFYGADFNLGLYWISFATIGGLCTIAAIANFILTHSARKGAKKLRKEGLITNTNEIQQAIINDSVEAMEKKCHKIFGQYRSEIGISWNESSVDDVYHSLKANSDKYYPASFLMQIAHETIKTCSIIVEYTEKKNEEQKKLYEEEQEQKREKLKKAAESAENRTEVVPRTGSEEG